MIKAVIFDMDGLMFDTETMFIDLVEMLKKKYGLSIPKEVTYQMIGTDSSIARRLNEQYPGLETVVQDYQSNRMEYTRQYFKKPGAANKKGLQELVVYLNEHQIPFAVASSSKREHILEMIDQAGFDLKPYVIISSKEGNIPGKPAPDIFLKAAEMMNMKPEYCLVLEDSKYGIMAAHNAGMKSVFIQDQIVPDEEMKQYIQIECDSLLDVIDTINTCE